MKYLYSDILPLELRPGFQTVADCITEQISQSDEIKIAVGYVSKDSLEELDRLIDELHVSRVVLTMGMYYVEGMPESTFHTAMRINKKWHDSNIGEIRLVRSFKYHGKVYCFLKNGIPFSAIIGSANMGVIKLDASNRRQYEFAGLTLDKMECQELSNHIDSINDTRCSANISDIKGLNLIREVNTSLDGIDYVSQVTPSNVSFYYQRRTETSFVLPIKVPSSSERFLDDSKHFTKSNINVCYAAPRSKRKSRDWFEVQMTVAKEITTRPGYPEKGVPFFVVTDDGYWFKAHTTSDGNKQFSAVGDELIMGRWIKGRLAASGLVKPVNDSLKDTNRDGMITKEMLDAYGCNTIVFTKTDQKAQDQDGAELAIWTLSFEAAQQQEKD